jgi:hypothetical protein
VYSNTKGKNNAFIYDISNHFSFRYDIKSPTRYLTQFYLLYMCNNSQINKSHCSSNNIFTYGNTSGNKAKVRPHSRKASKTKQKTGSNRIGETTCSLREYSANHTPAKTRSRRVTIKKEQSSADSLRTAGSQLKRVNQSKQTGNQVQTGTRAAVSPGEVLS